METSRAASGRAGDTRDKELGGGIGHTLRKPDRYIAKRAIEWSPWGKPRRRRLRQTWRRTRKAELKERQLTRREVKYTAQ